MPGGIHPPLEVIQSWSTPNYVDPPTRPKTVLIVACILGPITLCLFFARLWVRLRIQHNAGWDDWLMIVAIIPVIALTIMFPLVSEAHHFNKHVWDVQPHFFITQRKFVMAIESIFCVASGLIKISILLFYRRLSSRVISNTFRWATWVSIGFIAAYSIAFTLVPIFGCTPISAFWDQLDFVKVAKGYKYKCFNEGADVFAAGVISTVQDLITAMLPTFLYWNLKIPIRQKVALFGVFALGYGVVAIGAVRAYSGWHIFFETYDVTWAAWQTWLWTMLELHIGAMCANAPALKVFLNQFLKLERLTTRSKSRSDASKPIDHTLSATSRSESMFEKVQKVAFWKRKWPRSRNGYLSEPHTDFSVDKHGGVQAQSDIRITHSHALTVPERARNSKYRESCETDVLSTRFYDDIEMGHFVVDTSDPYARNGWEDLRALPAALHQPQSSHYTPSAAPNSQVSFPLQATKPLWHRNTII